MNLKLNTKYIFIFFVLTVALKLNAQESEQKDIILDEYTTISFGIIQPIAIGDNFASKGMNFPYGLDINFDYHFRFKLFLGVRFQYLRSNPDDISLVGNFDRTNINLYGLNLGYTFDISDKWSIQPVFTYGTTAYNNKKDFSGETRGRIKFTDNAESYIFSFNVNYKLNDKTYLYFKPDYRLDYTKIKTAEERQEFFENANFLNIQLGISMKFL